MTDVSRAAAINKLRAFARPTGSSAAAEWCDVCGAAVGPEHAHLVSPGALELWCACLACVASPPPGRLAVPRRVARVDAGRAAVAWEALGLPVGLGFVLAASAPDRRWIARLPGVAGATLAELSEDADGVLRDVVPSGLRPDVEALLVDRARGVAFVVSIDRCFELTGILRARGEVEPFFTALAELSGVAVG